MTPDQNGYLSHRQILVVMSGLLTGMFLSALDQSIVSTALPRITSDLGGLDRLSWVVTASVSPLWKRTMHRELSGAETTTASGTRVRMLSMVVVPGEAQMRLPARSARVVIPLSLATRIFWPAT